MSTSQNAREIGLWKREKLLGEGGFGYVVLWRNKETNDTIAIKECRWGHDPLMTPKRRDSWQFEVGMMFRLNHPNVVTAIPVPPELDVPPTELPLLAMEFCSNGDLRKLLSRPENCCGLKEKHVRLIMKHISSAVNYLHSRKVIHRDLKPENIVIQEEMGRYVYKLIDLGYAKELDEGSLCTSFVGTLQYLAPELFKTKKYSCTVDYWSLGLVTHEIITGSRPFLPDKSPAEWIPIIRQKSSTHIRAYLDEDKNIEFSSEIAPLHYISSAFKEDVEQWLRLMLEWDFMKRGRNANTNFLSLLETILSKKTALVFCAKNLKLYTIPISEGLTLEEFAKKLEEETTISTTDQEIILPNGHLPDAEKGASQFVANLEEEEYIIFLFDSKDLSSTVTPSSITIIPPAVEIMMRNPRTKVDYLKQRSVWAEAVFLCQQECILVSRVMQAFKSSLMNLITKTSCAHKSVSRMTAEMNKLLAKCSFFKCSLERDINYYEKLNKKGGFSSQEMYDDWKNILNNLKKIELLRHKVINLEGCSSNITAHAVELQKSPYARSRLKVPIEETHEKILESFSELKKRPKDQRRVPHDNTEIVRLLCSCLQHSHSHTQDLLSLIRKVYEIKQDINDCQPQLINLSYEIAEWEIQVNRWQSQRQKEIWGIIDSSNNKIPHSDEAKSSSPVCNSPVVGSRPSSSSGHVIPIQYTPDPHAFQEILKLTPSSTQTSVPVIIPHSYQSRTDSIAQSSSLSRENDSLARVNINSLSSSRDMSLSDFLDQASRDNKRVKIENQKLVESWQAMMGSLQSSKDSESMDTLQGLSES